MSTSDEVIEMVKPKDRNESSTKKSIRQIGKSLRKFMGSHFPEENDYSTDLHNASEKGDLIAIISLLSDTSTDKLSETINLPKVHGETVLHKATRNFYPGIIKILLNSEANPNLRDDDGNTPLHYLAKKILCDEILRERLLESLNILINLPDVDLNPINFNGETPLKLAVNLINDNKAQMSDFLKEFVEILTNKGSNADNLPESFSEIFADTIEGASGNSDTLSSPKALEAKVYNCIAGKNIKAIQKLWEGPLRMKPNTRNEIERFFNGRIGSKSILTKVVSDCDEDDVRFLLNELDVNPFVKDVDGEIALNASLSQNNSAKTELLVSKMKELHGGSYFNLDVVRNSSDIVKSYFIAKGAYIGNKDGTIDESINTKVLQMAFDNSINSYDDVLNSKDPDSPYHCAILNYDFLFPSSEQLNEESIQKAAFLLLSMIQKSEVKEAIDHPLMEVFVLLCSSMSRQLKCFDSAIFFFTNYWITVCAISGNEYLHTMIFSYLPMLMRECLAYVTEGKQYFRKFDNWIKLFILCGIISLISNIPADEDLQMNKILNHHIGWIMLTSSYFLISKMSGNYSLARYFEIVKKIMRNYFIALLPLLSTYLAFNYCFTIIFAPMEKNDTNDTSEKNDDVPGVDLFIPFLKTIPRTMAMIAGDFDYSSYSEASQGDPWYIELSSKLILILFIFFMFMVMTNVFTALAVGDIEVLKKNVTPSLLSSMLNDIYLYEVFFNITRPWSKRLFSFKKPIDIRKVIVKINNLSVNDRFYFFEKEEDSGSPHCYIDLRTRASLRTLYRKRIGTEKETPPYPPPNDGKDGSTELMVSKMEQLEQKMESRLTEISRNQEKLEFQLKTLIENLQQ